ncbi:MAG TPA: enoyl-CoA hydratase/isomerase family protein [Thermoanaerobaculia bacterium]|jgi:cyclohexa-1,5-dienecarbonyl-CoA hydratase|nr:enoyl-CoA hydratase/isomerase family protein [Thermoanaerobaculia bacterium]
MTLLLDRDGRTATVTINRPPLNILDIPTIQRLGEAIAELEDAQLVVIRGAGDRAFSAGVAVQDHTPELVGPMLESLHGAIRKLRDLPAVTVAAVRGHCLGGGMELALACDLVIATEDARFGQPEIELGCYPPVAAALYPSLIGPGRTLDLLLTGRTLTCEEAERMGLIARRVSSLDEGLAKLSSEILAKSAAVVRLTKKAVRAGRDHGFSEALAESERLYLDELCPTADMAEGVAAFLEKRQPVWKHR